MKRFQEVVIISKEGDEVRLQGQENVTLDEDQLTSMKLIVLGL